MRLDHDRYMKRVWGRALLFKDQPNGALDEVLWFIAGSLVHTGSSAAILWPNRLARSDPFAS
jgi:hypothetical protein